MSMIEIKAFQGLVTVRLAGHVIAATDKALTLKEGSYPAVLYLPRESLNAECFEASALRTYCPHKGEASYLHALVDGRRSENCAWFYDNPPAGVAAIKGYVAFYPDRVDAFEIQT